VDKQMSADVEKDHETQISQKVKEKSLGKASLLTLSL